MEATNEISELSRALVHKGRKERRNGALQNGARGNLGIWGGFVLSEVEGCYEEIPA